MSLVLLIVALILFIGLVVVHEYGHFVAARRAGVVAEEFSIFFGPALFKRKMRGGWLFSIRTLPLGGYVKLKGEHDSDTEPGSFGAASVWSKTKIMAAGVVFNLITALILLTLLALVGMPKLLSNQFTVKSDTQLMTHRVYIGTTEDGSPAQKAGLKSQDELTGMGLPGYSPVAITQSSKLPEITKRFAGKTVDVYFIRDGHDETTRLTLRSTAEVAASQKTAHPKHYLGISPTDYTLQRSTWSAPIVAVGFTVQATALTFQGLGHAIGGLGSWVAGLVTHNNTARQNGESNATEQVAGPVGIFYVLKGGSTLGYQFILFIIAIISLTLAIMNILPIPALDGGRLWLMLFTRAIKRPLSPKVEEMVNLAGFAFLMVLMVLITLVDIHRF